MIEPYFNIVINDFLNEKPVNIFSAGVLKPIKKSYLEYMNFLMGQIHSIVLYDEEFNKNFEDVIWDGDLFRIICKKYPILADRIIFCAYREIENIKKLIFDIEKTFPKYYQYFFGDEKFCKIKSIIGTGSDRHSGGRFVYIIEFENNKKVVYKPQSMDIDIAFYDFANFISKNIGLTHYYEIKIVKSEYGCFCEYYEHKNIENLYYANIYYEKMGLLCGIIFLLCGVDMSNENIIAVGDTPLAIDLETATYIMYNRYNKVQGLNNYDLSSTAFLPRLYNLLGLKHLDCDAITSRDKSKKNYPIYNDNPIDYKPYISNIERGFFNCLTYVIQNKKIVEEKIKCLFYRKTVRIILRKNMQYALFFNSLYNKKYMSDLSNYNDYIERFISNNDLFSNEKKEFIKEIERKDIKNCDIPYFYHTIDDIDIDSLISRVEKINKEEIVENSKLITWTLSKIECDAYRNVIYDCKNEEINNNNYSDCIYGIKKIARKLSNVILEKKAAIISDIISHKYFYERDIDNTNGYLEGKLGIFIALSSYKKIIKDDKCVNAAIDILSNDFCKDNNLQSSLTVRNIGITNGMAGLLVASNMLFQLGTITEEKFLEIINKVGENANKFSISIFDNDSPYSSIFGMLVAINRCALMYQTNELLKIKSVVIDKMNKNEKFKNYTEEDLVNYYRKVLFAEGKFCISDICCNNNLIFGNAGKLYYYVCDKNSECDNNFIKMVHHLSKIESVLTHMKPIDGIVEVGFFTGLSGVLYTLCKCINNEIPKFL